MGSYQSLDGRRRRSAAVAALVLPAATLLAAGADTVGAAGGGGRCCAEVVTARAGAPAGASATPGAARATRRIARPALPVGVAPETGMQVKTILAARAVSATFPEILDIGGVRADSLKWHPHGLAIDVMIPDYQTAAGIALGERIVAYALANADRFGVNHVIFRQVSYSHNGLPKRMGSRGSDTANHYDHVHIATDGGGFPTGRETYLR